MTKEDIQYNAEFVPQKFSRNSMKDPCLNFKVSIGINGKFLTTDYSIGSCHIPKGVRKHTPSEIIGICNTGIYQSGSWKQSRIPSPPIDEVLYALNYEISSLNGCFKSWAEDFGYDSDSIKAKAMYEDCCDISQRIMTISPKLHKFILEYREDYDD